jgi:hypothetical protein
LNARKSGNIPRHWTRIARIITILLIALNNLAISQAIPGSGPEIRVGYVMAVALIIWAWWFGKREWFPKQKQHHTDLFVKLLVGLLLVSTLSGIITIGILHLSSSFITALAVIILYSVTLYTLSKLFAEYELLEMYLKVVKVAVVAAWGQQLAWLMFKLDSTSLIRAIGFSCRFGGSEGWFARVTAWWQEPAHFAQFLVLAVLIAVLPIPVSLAKSLKLSPAWKIAILGAFVLTFSTSALPVVLFISLAFAVDRRRQWALLVVCALVTVWILGSHTISDRVQAIGSVSDDLADSNLSLWAITSNFLASVNSLPLAPFGLGVGNHVVAYEAWLKSIEVSALSSDQLYINSRDGGSMVTRLLTEFGIPSLVIWIYLTFRAVVLAVRKRVRIDRLQFVEYLGISSFFTLCLRQGSYSLFDPWFFLLLMLSARRSGSQRDLDVGNTAATAMRMEVTSRSKIPPSDEGAITSVT